ncbi:predicted protein [Postia placenta Mad-698-R]|uniref:Uncharacterized protein n=1 Tax=Postia placenta MAD-698-R-SB12 TaxID=670580 RepID=A0A1X6MUA7_9APHY|nr:hypothetical protein POSPLADRAFT_1149476 [Postia placenta MAD-698-R-SB12]EED82365.1 predicted protein [Postia placenta Mad-698-R]OSX59971.1 hypothetical protein POSPLADRAFT_1149476 [Postia placenta MAD-698-R-SB12]
MSSPYSLDRKGLLNCPGISPASKKITEDIIRYDADEHHCIYRAPSIHNHLSHHLLAVYDLGGRPSILQNIEKRRQTMQRPILLDPSDKDIILTDENWTQYLDNPNAYYGFVKFFSTSIRNHGVAATLEQYIFSDRARDEGKMIIRTYGIEFGHDQLVATGLAMGAVTKPFPAVLFHYDNPPAGDVVTNDSRPRNRQPSRGPSLLALLKDIYDSSQLAPVMPYDREKTIYDNLRDFMASDRPRETRRIISRYFVDYSSGEVEYETKPELLMSYSETPRPPVRVSTTPDPTCLGDPANDADYHPWPDIIAAALPFPDAHLPKTLRTLVYAAQQYGDAAPGNAIGAFVAGRPSDKLVETHTGTAQMDGTIFVRAAGMMMDYMGWATYGQKPRTDWDRSGLGWDDAWNDVAASIGELHPIESDSPIDGQNCSEDAESKKV